MVRNYFLFSLLLDRYVNATFANKEMQTFCQELRDISRHLFETASLSESKVSSLETQVAQDRNLLVHLTETNASQKDELSRKNMLVSLLEQEVERLTGDINLRSDHVVMNVLEEEESVMSNSKRVEGGGSSSRRRRKESEVFSSNNISNNKENTSTVVTPTKRPPSGRRVQLAKKVLD